MKINPRYDGPQLAVFDGPANDVALPLVRQRRRLLELLAELPPAAWQTQSRCAGWTVQDVAAHLVGVNQFWTFSIACAMTGKPSKLLANFDPAATPATMVAGMTELSHHDVLDQLTESTNALESAVNALSLDDWNRLGESPAGHVSLRLVAHHALWDSWIHERDIAIPLGLRATEEPDEVVACLRYAVAVGPLLALGNGVAVSGVFAVDGHHPDVQFTLTANDVITVGTSPGNAEGMPSFTGSSCDLIEMASIRTPMAPDVPPEWVALLGVLAATFATTPAS